MTRNNTQILGIIPARGGSKRLPKKNVKLLMGKHLIVWTIEQANKSRLLTKTIISTDDEEIARVAEEFNGLVPFKRPSELAKDDASSYDVIFHALDFFDNQGENYEIVTLLEPTSPLRDDGDIDNAIRSFLENYNQFDSLISIGEIHLEHPTHAKRITNSFVTPFCPETLKSTTLTNTKAYFPYGVIYISKVSALREHNSFYQPKTMYYLIKRWQNYEVDDIFDFYCIETIMKMRGLNT